MTSGEKAGTRADGKHRHDAVAGLEAALCIPLLMILAACAVGPDFVRPAAPEVDRYTPEGGSQTTVVAAGQAQRTLPGLALQEDWWHLFGSASLDALVQQAIHANANLEAAQASLRQSRNNLSAGYGVFFPQVSAGFSATRQRSAPIQLGQASSGAVYNLVTLSGSMGYTLDVFGGDRRIVEGLRAQVDARRYAERAAFLALTANVVNTAIARAAYAEQIRVTEQLIELQEQQRRGIEIQVRAGTVPESDVLAIRALLAANRATLAPLQQHLSQAEHLLAILTGGLPANAVLPDIGFTTLTLPTDLPISVPSELVHQRPDILAAEAQLHVASANIGVATAAMFPSLTLNADYGTASNGIGKLLGSGAPFWGIGPSLNIPLFRGGSLWYGRKAAIDAEQVSQAAYREVVLEAFGQVADALTAIVRDAQALQAQEEAHHVTGEALRLLQANYGAGLVAYVDVLVADVQFHQASIAYLQAAAQRQQDTVALFVALGGGWRETSATIPAEPRP